MRSIARTLLVVSFVIASLGSAAGPASAALPPADLPMTGTFTWTAVGPANYAIRLDLSAPLPPLAGTAFQVITHVVVTGNVPDVGRCTPEPGDTFATHNERFTMAVTKYAYNPVLRRIRRIDSTHPATFEGRRTSDFFTGGADFRFPWDYRTPYDISSNDGQGPYRFISETYDHGTPAPVIDVPLLHLTVPNGYDIVHFYTRIVGNCPPAGNDHASGDDEENVYLEFG